ncbi:hypothetical protein ACFLSE_04125 [Bacteroidota bacterium]
MKRFKVIVLLFITPIFMFTTSCDKDESGYALTVNINPVDAGFVIKNPDQSDYGVDAQVSLNATPNLGYYFSEWNGDISGSSNPVSVTMNTNKIITANFDEGIFEDFNDGIADYFNSDGSGRWNVTSSAYKMTGTNAKTTAYSFYPHDFGDFGLSVDMKVTQSGSASHAFGVYFKSQSEDVKVNSYRLSIMNNGTWYIGKYINSSFSFITDSWISSYSLYTGLNATNNIKILFVGTTVEIYFNDVYQGYASNMVEFTDGYIGVQAYDSDLYDNEFIFDNLIVVTTGINNLKSMTLKKNADYNLTKMKGIEGNPDGTGF